MGAFAGFGLGALASSNWLQGQQAMKFAQQQLQQRQLEQQLKNLELMQQLQQNQAYQQALSQVSPEERRNLILGETAGQWESQQQKRGTETAEASTAISALETRMTDPNLSPDDRVRILNLIQGLRSNPQSVAKLKELMSAANIGTRPAQRMVSFNLIQAARELRDQGAPINPEDPSTWGGYAQAITAKATADRQAATIAGGHPSISTEYEGTSAFRVSRDPYTLRELARVPAGVTKPTAQEIAALDEADIAQQGIGDILDAGKDVLPAEGGWGATLTPEALAIKGRMGDPKVYRYNAARIALIPHLRAVAGAARINPTEINAINGALAGATTYPALQAAIKQATKLLNQSRAILRRNMGMGPESSPDISRMISETGMPTYGKGGKVTSWKPVSKPY